MRRTRFARRAAFIYALALLWLIGVLIVALWPIPGKYPSVFGLLALIGVLIVGGNRGWFDDFMGLVLSVLILAALVFWTIASWELPKWVMGSFVISIVIPLASLVTLLISAGSADDLYEEWVDEDPKPPK